MIIKIFDTYDEMSLEAAKEIARQLNSKLDSYIGLTSGKTPVKMFEELVSLYRNKEVSFKDARISMLEEVVGLPKTCSSSCYGVVDHYLLKNTDLSKDNVIIPDGMCENIFDEAKKYTKTLDDLPDKRLDMQVLGLGEDGHIGMNRPAKELIADCHIEKLSNKSIESIKDKENIEVQNTIAMGVRQIMQAKTLLMIANGEHKADAVAKMVKGNVTTEVPASLLQLHPNVIVLLDKAAASLIK